MIFFRKVLFNWKCVILLFCLTPFFVKSLNVFEMSLIGIGTALVYNQYFDKSLNEKSEIYHKSRIINDYYESKKVEIGVNEFSLLPIQEKMMVIETIHSYNN